MFLNFFTKKTDQAQDLPNNSTNLQKKTKSIKRLSLAEQREEQYQRKRLVIDEFEKSLINLQLEHGIWTPLYIVDIFEVNLPAKPPWHEVIKSAFNQCYDAHKQKLRQRIYRESFNFQSGELLIVVKDEKGEIISALKESPKNIKILLQRLKTGEINSSSHKLLLVRYFVPPVPDDLYKCDSIQLPSKFEQAVKEIVNYCDLNYCRDNLSFEKWEKLVKELDKLGFVMTFPDTTEKVSLTQLLTENYSNVGYHRIKVEEIVKDTIDKNPVIIPLFILLLGFFCSERYEDNSLSYHYLFNATGDQKKLTYPGEENFPKLFNKLLDESLLPNQFRKCLATIYYEAFMLRQYDIDDLLFSFREKYLEYSSIS